MGICITTQALPFAPLELVHGTAHGHPPLSHQVPPVTLVVPILVSVL